MKKTRNNLFLTAYIVGCIVLLTAPVSAHQNTPAGPNDLPGEEQTAPPVEDPSSWTVDGVVYDANQPEGPHPVSPQDKSYLFDLSLSELMEIEVISAHKVNGKTNYFDMSIYELMDVEIISVRSTNYFDMSIDELMDAEIIS